MINRIEEFFYKRHVRKQQIVVDSTMSLEQKSFCKVLNTLRENRIMVQTKEDGVYIRLAGGEPNMISMQNFVKVVDFIKK